MDSPSCLGEGVECCRCHTQVESSPMLCVLVLWQSAFWQHIEPLRLVVLEELKVTRAEVCSTMQRDHMGYADRTFGPASGALTKVCFLILPQSSFVVASFRQKHVSCGKSSR